LSGNQLIIKTMKLLNNTWHAIVNLLMPKKAMPLTDEWLYMDNKELRKHVGMEHSVKVAKTIQPEERNSSSLKSVKDRRVFNTTTKNTLKCL